MQSVGRGDWLWLNFDGLAPFAAYDIITENARKTNERMLNPLSVFNEYFDLSVCDDSMVLVAGYQLVFHFFSYHISTAVLLVKRENYLAGAS